MLSTVARPSVYRHDVRCPKCGFNQMPRDGISKGRQVHHCGDCGRRTIPDAAYQRPSAADQERALAMYQEGSSLSAIARIFGVGVQTVSKWVKRPAALARMRRQCAFRPAAWWGTGQRMRIPWESSLSALGKR